MLQFYETTFYSVLFLIPFLVGAFSLKLPADQSLLWLYVCVSSAIPAFSIFYNPKYLNSLFLTASKVTAGQSLALALLVPIVALLVRKYFLLNLLKVFFIFEAASIIIVGRTLTLGWDSFSSVMLSLSLLLFYPTQKKLDIFFLVLIFLASLRSMAVTTMLIYAFFFSILAWEKHKLKVVVALIGALSVFIYLQPPELVTGNGRFPMWSHYITVWWDKLPKVFGIGMGTWEWVAPSISEGRTAGYMIVHNDFLQLLFEGGVVGLILLTVVLVRLFLKHRKSQRFILAMGSFLIAMMFYFPLHIVVGQLLGSYFLLYSHEEKWE